MINNTSINASHSGTLIVETAANNNDWDGAADTGRLTAITGDLEIRDNIRVLFHGTVTVEPRHFVLANGFELEFEPESTLNLRGGTYRSTVGADVGGQVLVGIAVADSTLANDIRQTFENTSFTNLNGNLRLDSPVTTIEVGAEFSGGGSLINLPDRTLRLLDGLTSDDLGVLIENQGTLDLGSSPGQVSAKGFKQTASGQWNLELGGTGLNEFDRLNLTGAALLAGALRLSRIDSSSGGFYVPVLGQAFDILSAAGGVSGTFTEVHQPGMPAGLLFDVVYSPTMVQLVVVNATTDSADFDLDGDVDGADLAVWRSSFGVNDGADADNDGDSDGTDFLAWQRQLGSVPVVSAAGAVPEPSTLLLFIVAAAGLLRLGGRKRQELVNA